MMFCGYGDVLENDLTAHAVKFLLGFIVASNYGRKETF